MNFRQKFLKGVSKIIGTPLTSVPNMSAYNPWEIDESDGVKRKAVYTSAFWLAPPYGRPRDIDYERLEPLEKNAWIRMCVQHIIDSVVGAEYHIIPRVKGEEVGDEILKEVREFFEGAWQEDLKANLRMMLPDMLNYDCGVIIKAFGLTDYEEDGNLKALTKKMKPIELYSRDGRSFMKDTGLAGRLRQYWQYSWINPQGRPIRFSPDEIMYFQMNPSSRSPYGIANLEVIETIVDYMIESAMAQSKYWKNGMFIGGQIDLPEVKEINELKRMQAYYEAKLRGSRKMNKWIITGGGATVKSIPFTPQQMQWVESQKWFAKIIFGIYKVTPSELGFCHSEDTEFLTSDGWKLYDNIEKGEKIGTYNKNTEMLEFQEPIKYYHYPYKGEMVHFNGRSIDALVTPNHRMFVQPYDYKDDWRIVEAKDVSWSQFHFKQACNWEGKEIDTIKVPVPVSKKHDTVKRKELEWKVDDFLELLGWFVSEGCATEYGTNNGHYRIDISQNRGENSEKIRSVLNRLEIGFNEFENKVGNISFIIQNKQIYDFIKPMKDKLPEWIFELSPRQLEIFLDSLCRGDGHLCNSKNSRFEFYTTKKTIADQVHEISIKCGYRTNLSKRGYENKNWKDLYTLYMSKYTDKAYLEQKNISKEQYNGFVNCFAVPNGFLITRRNGKILISHNTEDLNKATGIQQMEIHKSKAIKPVLTSIEEMFNRRVVWQHFSDKVKFEYAKELSLDDNTKQTEIDVKRLDKGLDSVNELRDRDGLDKWDDEKWDKPAGSEGEGETGEDEYDWDSYFGASDEPEEPEDKEKDNLKKMFGDLPDKIIIDMQDIFEDGTKEQEGDIIEDGLVIS